MTQKEKSVHFGNRHQIEPDVIENSENEEHELSSSNDQYLTNVSSSAVKSGGDMHSVSSISTSILDDAEEVKELKNKLGDIEAKCKILEINNEKNKNSKLEKKLQFVKDNQEVFMRLKEAYINMKYNEAAGRKMIEVREKNVQTWEGIICRACIETEELRRKMDSLKETYKNAIIVAPTEIEQLVNTVNYLGGLITRREKSWMVNAEKSNQLQGQISILQNENETLKSLIQSQQANTDEKQIVDHLSSDVNIEITQLKKIIIKYEKKFKEMEKQLETPLSPILNDKDRKVVQQLMLKYNARIHKNKTRSLSVERDIEIKVLPKKVRSKSGSRLIHDIKTSSELFKNDNQNPDVTIQMMEYLFDGCT